MAEFNQLCKQYCFETILVKDLTTSERKKYFDAIMLLTENNNGDVKGKGVFNGKQLRVWTTKYAANESIMITK